MSSSGERVSQLKGLEFPEITIIRIDRANTVLEQDGRDMRVWYKISTNDCFAGDMLVGIEESVELGHRANMRKTNQ